MKGQQLFALASLGLLMACSNPFRESYESTLERWPYGEASQLLPADAEPKIVTSDNMRQDAQRLMEDGYLLLGRSRFRGSEIDPRIALDQAKEVGASIVVVAADYAQSVTEAVPMTEWIPDRDIYTTERTYIESGPDAGTVIETDVLHTIEGEHRTIYVPQTTDYYDYAATFWGKSKPPIFGVLVGAMDDAERQRLQSNHGVRVKTVIRNSPAFAADILRNDIIFSFAGQTVSDPRQFFDLVMAHQGETIAVQLDRNGERKTFHIQLATE